MKLLHKIFGIGISGLIVSMPLAKQTPAGAELSRSEKVVAQAESAETVQINLSAAKKLIVVTAEGTEEVKWQSLSDNAVVQPGDTLRYTVSSQNTGTKPADNLTITQPIPEQMVYELDTVTSQNQAQVVFSIDNGKTFVAKPMIEVETENGKKIEQSAPAETYTHIRWKFGSLKPDADIAATYKVKVQ